jgi:acetyltransferase-like isoleucine patch superfamily enzyme
VLLGADVKIFDTDFHTLSPENRRYNTDPDNIPVAPVKIDDNVFVGTGAIIMMGTTIGENSVIGAGSVVRGAIPANVIAAGNPARVIRAIA